MHVGANEGVDGAAGDLQDFLLRLEQVKLKLINIVAYQMTLPCQTA